MTKEELEKAVRILTEENRQYKESFATLSGELMRVNLKIQKLEEMIEDAIEEGI